MESGNIEGYCLFSPLLSLPDMPGGVTKRGETINVEHFNELIRSEL